MVEGSFSYLLPSDSWYRSADCSSIEDDGFSFLDVHRCEALDKLGRYHLFLFDDVQVALERGFSSLVFSHACHCSRVRAAYVRYHQGVVSGFVYEDLVGRVVRYLVAIDVPAHLWIWAAGHAAIESAKR